MSIHSLYESNSIYTVHTFPSREEWLNGRMEGIGGSSASACLNLNPYMTSAQLYRVKKGIEQADDISDKPYVKYGNDAEDPLRRLFALDYPEYEVQYQDNTLLRSKEVPFFYYSPDGLLLELASGRQGILEVKTTNILQSQQKEKWNDAIPQNYYIQILHGLTVTGFDFVELIAQLKWEFEENGRKRVYKKIQHYHIERSEVLEDLGYVHQGVFNWWTKHYIADKEPPITIGI